eukprot:1848405-Pyramimonas_sp.AAC.1
MTASNLIQVSGDDGEGRDGAQSRGGKSVGHRSPVDLWTAPDPVLTPPRPRGKRAHPEGEAAKQLQPKRRRNIYRTHACGVWLPKLGSKNKPTAP